MDSRSNNCEKIASWRELLASGIEASQIDALRQISCREMVCGLATQVVALAGDQREQVRIWAAEAMETAVQPEPSDVAKLIELMDQSADGEISYWAATMLGRLGIAACSAVETLEHCLLHCEYLAARERAVWALSQIGPQATAVLPSLKKIATQENHVRLKRLAGEVVRRFTEEPEMLNRRKRA